MFYAMDSIKTLDLSSFNTSNVEDVSQMFYGNPILKTTYVMDQILKIEEDKFTEEQPVKIVAMPKEYILKKETSLRQRISVGGFFTMMMEQKMWK